MVLRTLILILTLVLADGTAAARDFPNARSPMGINLSSVSYWSTELAFVNIFNQSQPWTSQDAGKTRRGGGRLNLTRDGWVIGLGPGQCAETIVCRNGGHYPAGEYVCLYDGTGKIEFKFDARVKSRSKGRILVHVNPSDAGIVLRIRDTLVEDPVRNIRLIMPGFESSYREHPFNPDFLKLWSRFKVIRFMDWMRTNNSGVVTWADRPTPEMQTQGGERGVALEYMIQLANLLHADPWFCMPHMASHDYVYNFAAMVRERLDPDLRVYVEYTNEAWNEKFDQARYCRRMGLAMGLSDDPFQAQLFFYAKRSVEIFRVWEDVFGGAGRLVRVMASQSENPWTSRQVLSYEDAWRHADALAVAPYFGKNLGAPGQQEKISGMTVEQLFQICRDDIGSNQRLLAMHEKEAAIRGLDLIAYEGGQHLVGWGGAENNRLLAFLFQQANRHPKMKALYLDDLTGWKKAGGKLFVTFSSMGLYNKWGSWGLLEYMGQDPATAPKYQGVLEFIEKNPAWWGGDRDG